MTGRRVYPGPDGFYKFADLKPGDFLIYDGEWYGITPNGSSLRTG